MSALPSRKPGRALKRRIAVHQSYTSSLVSAKPRSLLKLDQAYIAVGGREHLTLVRETDIMRTIVRRKSPPELQRCRLEHSICRDAEVPSSTQSAPLSPVGVNQDAHRTDSRIPLGPRSPSSIAPDMYPHMVCPIPQTAGRRLPAYPFPPGRATDGSAVCLFTRWFTAA